MLSDLEKFNNFIKNRNEFSAKTFGSPTERNCMGPLYHLKKEINELIENPDDTMEWADCFLLILDAAWRKGYSVDDMVSFASKKLEINKTRNWGLPDENGAIHHIE